jgi:hypothetical protein
MTGVKVRYPGLQVLLRKNIGRAAGGAALPVSERFAGQQRTVDLTPFFGEAGAVQTNKSVREPAGGFTLTFSDRINPAASDTVYGLVEPMDVIEIRMSGDAYKTPQASTGTFARADRGQASLGLPIIMRGLVSGVRRVETMGADGRPQRSVVITGQDYGKIWQMLQIVNSPFVDPDANFITAFPFFARFGNDINTQYAEAFVKDVFDKVINPFIAKMATKTGGTSSPLLSIGTDGIQVRDGVVSPFGVGGWQGGTIYSLLAQHCDVGPWNELYIEDLEAGPRVVYRPNPFMTADGKSYIMDVVVEPHIVPITRADVVSMAVERSDANVANYFWVDAPRFALNADETLRLMSYQAKPDDVYQQGYGNNDPELYGFRRLQEQTQQGGRGETHNGNGLQAGNDSTVYTNAAVAWLNLRRRQLRDLNQDNVVLEHGQIRLKGNEQVKAGAYLRLTHGNMQSDYYVVSVTHDFIPFGGFFTTAVVERGTGFVDRVQQGDGSASPYWSELAGD